MDCHGDGSARSKDPGLYTTATDRVATSFSKWLRPATDHDDRGRRTTLGKKISRASPTARTEAWGSIRAHTWGGLKNGRNSRRPAQRIVHPNRLGGNRRGHAAIGSGIRRRGGALASRRDDGQHSHMQRATISYAKNNFSRLLALVRQGESILVLDRNTPVARIDPVDNRSLQQ